MCFITLDGKTEFIKENTVRETFFRRDKCGTPFLSETSTDGLDIAEDINGRGGTLDGRTGNFNIFRFINNILPFNIIGTDFPFKFIPTTRHHHLDTPRSILKTFQQTTHACGTPFDGIRFGQGGFVFGFLDHDGGRWHGFFDDDRWNFCFDNGTMFVRDHRRRRCVFDCCWSLYWCYWCWSCNYFLIICIGRNYGSDYGCCNTTDQCFHTLSTRHTFRHRKGISTSR
mmetsp:Transcript_26028/g.29125  ORF Transcript_26028/g.29125 Transcript_26028/m.29125 type:complete len:227 (-) Transcript_26028:109-789(-)